MGKLRELENKRDYYQQRADELNAEIGKLKNPDDIDEAHLKMLMRGHRWPTRGQQKLIERNPILKKIFAIASYAWDKSSAFGYSEDLAERLPKAQRAYLVQVVSERSMRGYTKDGYEYCPLPRLRYCAWPRRVKTYPLALVEITAQEVGPCVWTELGGYEKGTILAYRYLAAICQAGIWLDTGRFAGQRREGRGKIYAVGYWGESGRVPFLKDIPQWMDRLLRLTIQNHKGKANYNG
jgi:hypothetical protein